MRIEPLTQSSSRAEDVAIHSLGRQWIAASLALLAMTAVQVTALKRTD